MSLFPGIADDQTAGLVGEVHLSGEAKNVTAGFVRWGTRLGVMEMLLSGTTTFTDMYYFEEVVAESRKKQACVGYSGRRSSAFRWRTTKLLPKGWCTPNGS
jgi:5-methylthioadenosine/S-adenosylhomocysteine deaminase